MNCGYSVRLVKKVRGCMQVRGSGGGKLSLPMKKVQKKVQTNLYFFPLK